MDIDRVADARKDSTQTAFRADYVLITRRELKGFNHNFTGFIAEKQPRILGLDMKKEMPYTYVNTQSLDP
jgi:hypothetical protein